MTAVEEAPAVPGRTTRPPGGLLLAEFDDGCSERLDASAWAADADPVDRRLLARCAGPTVDLGCGPGRLTAALAARGVPVLGVDVSPDAVAVTRRRGVPAIRRDVFDTLPGDGRWRCALLADGNVGIGGDPGALLRRVRRLLAPGGLLLAEVHPGDVERRGTARLVAADGLAGRPFAWAAVGEPALLRVSDRLGWWRSEAWTDGGRRFVALVRG